MASAIPISIYVAIPPVPFLIMLQCKIYGWLGGTEGGGRRGRGETRETRETDPVSVTAIEANNRGEGRFFNDHPASTTAGIR